MIRIIQGDITTLAVEAMQEVAELSGQPYDPDDPELHTACSQTCRNLLADVSTAALEGVLVQLVRYLIRSKWFKDATLWGCLCVAVDGTMCERKRGSALSDKEKRRCALEARIATPWGWDIPPLASASPTPPNATRSANGVFPQS